jgi:hypothetical protein
MTNPRISHFLSEARSARAHLLAALGQSLPSDDVIILEHVSAAELRLAALIGDLQAERDAGRGVAA